MPRSGPVDYLWAACRLFVDWRGQKQFNFLDRPGLRKRLLLDIRPGKRTPERIKKGPGGALFSGEDGLLLAQHRDVDGDRDVGMQRDLDREVAHLLERSLRHPHVRALDLVALFFQRLDDVVVGDRAEQATVRAGLLRDLEREAFQLLAAALRRR